MELLQEGDSNVGRLIQKDDLHLNCEYRLSAWVFCSAADGFVALYHTLSKRMYLLNQEEWSAVKTGDYSSTAAMTLIKQRFLVEKEFDDLAQYQMVLGVLRRIEYTPGTKTFTILPTTGCNARCVYCYQQGISARTMTEDVADRIIDYICETKQKGRIKLHWFGGEPLCAPDMITKICKGLREKGIDFYSSITTNGSLFTPVLIREAVECWKLEKAQVSMDGAREDYERRKRYLRPDLYHYDVVMENIHRLAEAGVEVVIRCNCDLENMQRAYQFVDDCVDRFSDTGNVRVVPALLNQGRISAQESAVSHSLLWTLKEYASKRGFQQKKGPLTILRVHQCMADSGGKGILIDPQGGLFACEEKVGGEPLGSIFDPKPPVWPSAPLSPAEECCSCCFLPECTPLYRQACLVCPVNCRMVKEQNYSRYIKSLVLKSPFGAGVQNEEPFDETC